MMGGREETRTCDRLRSAHCARVTDLEKMAPTTESCVSAWGAMRKRILRPRVAELRGGGASESD